MLSDAGFYEKGFEEGFDRGQEAAIQQVDGIIDNAITPEDAIGDIREMIEEFWKEREQ